MSKAFTKEDDALPERSGRRRTTSGLPPGALNYMTSAGARRLRTELATLSQQDSESAADLAAILASATIVEPPAVPPEGAVFGARVTLEDASGGARSFRIVGVDEAPLEADAVTWTSPVGRALLGAEPGQRVKLPDESRSCKVLRVDY